MGGVNTTPHTVHFSQWLHAHAGLKFGSALTHPIHAHVSCVICCVCLIAVSLRLLHSLLLPHHLFSNHPVLPSARQRHLPGCGGQIPCVLPLRTLAPWPRTSLPHSEKNTPVSSVLRLKIVAHFTSPPERRGHTTHSGFGEWSLRFAVGRGDLRWCTRLAAGAVQRAHEVSTHRLHAFGCVVVLDELTAVARRTIDQL